MLIYFLIENFDVDHSPQCFENTLTHFNIKVYCCPLGLGPRSMDNESK